MSEWHIPVMKPNQPTEPNPPALVHCKIMEIAGGYVFVGPKGNPHSTAPGLHRGGSFEFPMFQARLSGDGEKPWFITVESLVVGENSWGYVSNIGFHHGPGQDDPDTWVAHAGATVEEGDGKDAAAASASSTLR